MTSFKIFPGVVPGWPMREAIEKVTNLQGFIFQEEINLLKYTIFISARVSL